MFFMTFITVIVGVIGCVMAANVLFDDKKSDAEMQAARILQDGIDDWVNPLVTDVQIVEGKDDCPSGWDNLFSNNWKGIMEGCSDYGNLKTKLEF